MLNRPLPIQTEANNTEPDGTGGEHFGGRVSGKKCVSVNQTLGVSGDHDLSGIGSALKRAPTTELLRQAVGATIWTPHCNAVK